MSVIHNSRSVVSNRFCSWFRIVQSNFRDDGIMLRIEPVKFLAAKNLQKRFSCAWRSAIRRYCWGQENINTGVWISTPLEVVICWVIIEEECIQAVIKAELLKEMIALVLISWWETSIGITLDIDQTIWMPFRCFNEVLNGFQGCLKEVEKVFKGESKVFRGLFQWRPFIRRTFIRRPFVREAF